MRDFDHSLPFLLLQARETCMARFRPILNAHGLTEQQWRVLRALAESKGLAATALAARTLILRPSLTGIIDRLERDGLVVRKKSATDGRKACICMTPRARRLYNRIMPLVEAEYAGMRSGFDEKSWEALYDSLFHLIEHNQQECEPHFRITGGVDSGSKPFVPES